MCATAITCRSQPQTRLSLDCPCPQFGSTLKICKTFSRLYRVWFPACFQLKEKGTCTNHNPDVLIRIKRDLNNAEEATRSATLGADLTRVASLAESFSQLRSRNNTVKSDLVDALDREGQFSPFSSFPSLTQHDDKRTVLGQASIFGMLLELSLQIRWDDRWWPVVSP